MIAHDVLADLASAGVSVTADGDALVIRPASRLTDDMRWRLRAAKPELLVLLGNGGAAVTDVTHVTRHSYERETTDPAWWRDLFEERAAVREHDGGLSCADAEAGALADCTAHWRALNLLPVTDDRACIHCGKPGPDTPVLAHGGHAWLHRDCWAPMNLAREREALAAVRAMLDGPRRGGPLAG